MNQGAAGATAMRKAPESSGGGIGRMPKFVYALPLGLFLVALTIGIVGAGTGVLDILSTPLMASIPLKAYSVTIILLIGSICIVFLGTIIYFVEEKFFNDSPIPNSYGGEFITASLVVGSVSLIAIAIFALVGLISLIGIDVIEQSYIQMYFNIHSYVVFFLFFLFIAVDWLMYIGADLATKKVSDTCGLRSRHEPEYLHMIVDRAEFIKSFAFAQILLIDLPVVIGAGTNILLELLVVDAPKFQGHGADIYMSGLTAGFLAAHTIVSQLVFVMLNIFGDQLLKRRR